MIPCFLLVFLMVRHAFAADRSPVFLGLISLCALQALIISLAQHYGLGWAMLVQPLTGIFIPPFAWLSFQTVALGRLPIFKVLLHAGVPVTACFCSIIIPPALDILLPLAFAGYGIAILLKLRNEEVLAGARLQSGPLPRLLWCGVGVLLMLSAVSDVLIAAVMIMDQPHLRPLIISLFTSFTLLGVGLLGLSRDAVGPVGQTESSAAENTPSGPTEADTELVTRLDHLMQSEELFLDPDLTLGRLAKRLRVPAKHLSIAINKVSGQNVSRYVNDHRVRAACSGLQSGQTVTEAMLSSGFNTKSNFNREFTRVTGQTPTQFLSKAA